METRKLITFFSFLLLSSFAYAEGPRFHHKDPVVQQEVENIYKDLRGTRFSSSTYLSAPLNTSSGTVTNIRTSSITFPTNGQFLTNNGTIISSFTAAGEILQPLQPSFLARLSATKSNVTGDGTTYDVVFDQERFDQGADFDVTTFTFTAPVTGKYSFYSALFVSGQSAAPGTASIRLVTSNESYYGSLVQGTVGTSGFSLLFSGLVDMDANDTALIRININGGAKNVDLLAESGGLFAHFSGSLIN